MNKGDAIAFERIRRAAETGEKELDLSGLNLTDVPRSISQLTELRKLSLSNNRLTEVPESVTQLHKLTVLDLSANQIAKVSKDITNLDQLKFLDLRYNLDRSIPHAVLERWTDAAVILQYIAAGRQLRATMLGLNPNQPAGSGSPSSSRDPGESPSWTATGPAGNNPWRSGLFYVIAFIAVLGAMTVVATMVSEVALAMILLASLHVVTAIATTQLRNDERLTDKYFAHVIGGLLRWLPQRQGAAPLDVPRAQQGEPKDTSNPQSSEVPRTVSGTRLRRMSMQARLRAANEGGAVRKGVRVKRVRGGRRRS